MTEFDAMPVQAYMAIATVLLLPFVYIQTLKKLAPLSTAANIFNFVGLVSACISRAVVQFEYPGLIIIFI